MKWTFVVHYQFSANNDNDEQQNHELRRMAELQCVTFLKKCNSLKSRKECKQSQMIWVGEKSINKTKKIRTMWKGETNFTVRRKLKELKRKWGEGNGQHEKKNKKTGDNWKKSSILSTIDSEFTYTSSTGAVREGTTTLDFIHLNLDISGPAGASDLLMLPPPPPPPWCGTFKFPPTPPPTWYEGGRCDHECCICDAW